MTDRRYTEFKGNLDRQFYLQALTRYAGEKQELDKFLERLITPVIRHQHLHILDAGCGVGHLCRLLRDISPTSTFLGIDQTSYLVDQAREICRHYDNIAFEVGDVYDLPARFPKAFDVTLSWKVLSWLPHYDQMVEALIACTRGHVFLSSMFYDGDIDFEIRVREHQKEGGADGFNAFYNVYSLPRFEQFVRGLGVANIDAQDFEIDIDLPRSHPDHMGTYTARLDSGKRLQISGAVVMSWKVIRLDLA